MILFNKWKSLIAASVMIFSLVIVYNVAMFATGNFNYIIGQSQGVKLGLDLKGGSYVTIAIDESVVVADYINQTEKFVKNNLSERGASFRSVNKESVDSTDNFQFKLEGSEDFDFIQIELSKYDSKNLNVSFKDNILSVSLSDSGYKFKIREAIDQTIEILTRRLNQSGTEDITLQRLSDKYIVVQVPGIDDPEVIQSMLGTTARLSFHLVNEAATFSGAPINSDERYISSNDGYTYAVKSQSELTGENISNARFTIENNKPVVVFNLDSTGGEIFSNVTANNINKYFAIVLDNVVISAPVIQDHIPSGNGVINGNFTAKEAEDLALLLKSGRLPAPISIVEERLIGPTMGLDSIKSGVYALSIGLIMVFIYMIIFYRSLGVISVVALICNLILIVSTLVMLGVSLTLPGIAGIVITIGMAVDANVLVYERYKSELVHNKPYIAMCNAFNKVYITLLDANITSLLAAIILVNFGSGPIKGFAFTFIIGILTSMFSIMFITRAIINSTLFRGR